MIANMISGMKTITAPSSARAISAISSITHYPYPFLCACDYSLSVWTDSFKSFSEKLFKRDTLTVNDEVLGTTTTTKETNLTIVISIKLVPTRCPVSTIPTTADRGIERKLTLLSLCHGNNITKDLRMTAIVAGNDYAIRRDLHPIGDSTV